MVEFLRYPVHTFGIGGTNRKRGGITVKTVQQRIRELREDNDLRQKDVADLLGTTQQVYSRYEKGINEIPVCHLITLARHYRVSLDYLVGETDVRTRYPQVR